ASGHFNIEFSCELCACLVFFCDFPVQAGRRSVWNGPSQGEIRNSKSQIRNPVMLRFVVLIHDYPGLHWDFMLENEAILRTWRLARSPDATGMTDAEPLPDHRLAYLDYEGPVSGNRGSVRRFDRGEYALVEETPHRIEVRLNGAMLKGRAVIERRVSIELWTFQFERDDAPLIQPNS